MTPVTVDDVQHRQSTTATQQKSSTAQPKRGLPPSLKPNITLPAPLTATTTKLKSHFKLHKANSIDVIVGEKVSEEVLEKKSISPEVLSHHYLNGNSFEEQTKKTTTTIRVLCRTPQPSRHQLARGARFLTTIALACDPSRIGEPLGAISPKVINKAEGRRGSVEVSGCSKTAEENSSSSNNGKNASRKLLPGLHRQTSVDQSKT